MGLGAALLAGPWGHPRLSRGLAPHGPTAASALASRVFLSLCLLYQCQEEDRAEKNAAGFYKVGYNRAGFSNTFPNETRASQELCETVTNSTYRRSCSDTINTMTPRPLGVKKNCHRVQMGILPSCTCGVAQQTGLHYQLLQ